MEGRAHTWSGVAGGLAAAPVLGFSTLLAAAPFTLLVGGSALLPDLDCPSATASRQFGRVSATLSHGVSSLSGWLYQRTKGPRDEPWTGKHRHLSHTIAFALVVGGALAGICLAFPPAALAIYALLAILTADRLGTQVYWPAGLGAVPLTAMIWADPQFASWQIGAAVALGMVIHDLGDALTLMGCPLLSGLWPFQIRGETWFEVRLLGPLSFRTGGPVERCGVVPALIGATAGLALARSVPHVEQLLDEIHLSWLVPLVADYATTASLLVAGLTTLVIATQRTAEHCRKELRVYA